MDRAPQGARGLKHNAHRQAIDCPAYRAPQGARGLKPDFRCDFIMLGNRAPQGARGLKRKEARLAQLMGGIAPPRGRVD